MKKFLVGSLILFIVSSGVIVSGCGKKGGDIGNGVFLITKIQIENEFISVDDFSDSVELTEILFNLDGLTDLFINLEYVHSHQQQLAEWICNRINNKLEQKITIANNRIIFERTDNNAYSEKKYSLSRGRVFTYGEGNSKDGTNYYYKSDVISERDIAYLNNGNIQYNWIYSKQ